MNGYKVNRNEDYISHHGIKGMKWGVRRYQNKDGSLTPAGEVRYGSKTGNANGKKLTSSSREKIISRTNPGLSYTESKIKIKEGARENLERFPVEKINKLKKMDKDLKTASVDEITEALKNINSRDDTPIDKKYNIRHENSKNVVIATEMAFRGYDVKARPSGKVQDFGDLDKTFMDADFKDLSSPLPKYKSFHDYLDKINKSHIYDHFDANFDIDLYYKYADDYYNAFDKDFEKESSNVLNKLLKQGDGARGVLFTNNDYARTQSGDGEKIGEGKATNYKYTERLYYVVKNGTVNTWALNYANEPFSYEDLSKKQYWDPWDIAAVRLDNLKVNDNVGKYVYSRPSKTPPKKRKIKIGGDLKHYGVKGMRWGEG